MTSGIYPWTMPQKFTFLIFPLRFLLYINIVKKTFKDPQLFSLGTIGCISNILEHFDLSDVSECFLEAPVGMCSAH